MATRLCGLQAVKIADAMNWPALLFVEITHRSSVRSLGEHLENLL
jgi:hypothetical protein